MITNDEIAKLAREYAEEATKGIDLPNCLKQEAVNMFAEDMAKKINWLLRTHCIVSKEKVNEAEGEVISGWVARDKKDNTLNLHAEEPYRTQSAYQQGDEPDWWESACASFLPLDKGLFPSLTWDSEPMEVEITIKPKKR